MIILAGTVRIQPGMRDKAIPHIQTMVAASRVETGCTAFDFSIDIFDDHLVRVFEIYESQAALDAHRDTPHFAAWRAGWAECGIGDRAISEYDATARKK